MTPFLDSLEFCLETERTAAPGELRSSVASWLEPERDPEDGPLGEHVVGELHAPLARRVVRVEKAVPELELFIGAAGWTTVARTLGQLFRGRRLPGHLVGAGSMTAGCRSETIC